MQTLKELRNKIINGKIDIENVGDMRESLQPTYYKLLSHQNDNNIQEIEDFLMICLDYYTYSENGDTLISDNEYDTLMRKYCSFGREMLVWADSIKGQKTWPFIKHEMPGMVGSISKIYTPEELIRYFNSWKPMNGYRSYCIAPKFDGVSVCIKVVRGKIISGATRYDGVDGQDITEVVKRASNNSIFSTEKAPSLALTNGYFKCELVVTQKNFESILEEKRYANRRSATTGIINTPKNLYLAKYITIIPLAQMDEETNDFVYFPKDSYKITPRNADDLLKEIHLMLETIRSSEYDIRTDGVVLFPYGNDVNINANDIMSVGIAYKVNTEEAYTTIEYGYVSVGKLGYAVPMLHVKAVEVNETVVQDVSLGSFDKYAAMDLHEGERIIVFSAGNVIPQARVPEDRHYKASADFIKIKKRCPYCEEKLTRINNEYKCTNSECGHVIAGQITNFVVKLKVKNIADGTIDALYIAKLLTDIPSLFTLKFDDIANLDGFGETSAAKILHEINNLQTREIPVSVFVGSLGIPDISEKKCRNIFKYVSLSDLLEKSDEKLLRKVINADNTGLKTAEIFVKFVHDNRKMIKKLSEIMNIVTDIKWKGNVCFTGFRDPKREAELNELRYEVSDSVNSDTVAVVAASYSPLDANPSGKIKNAIKKGIDILQYSEIDTLIKALKRKIL